MAKRQSRYDDPLLEIHQKAAHFRAAQDNLTRLATQVKRGERAEHDELCTGTQDTGCSQAMGGFKGWVGDIFS